MPVNDGSIRFDDARIVFRNFAGEARTFNDEGKRNFNLVLSDDVAEQMVGDGWNVKTKPPREEGDGNFNILHVTVSFKGRPPRIVLITSKGRTNLDEDTCALLDIAEMEVVDLIIRPYDWKIKSSGATGRKAYLQSIYVTLYEDALERKYADVPEILAREEQLAIAAEPYLELVTDGEFE